MPAEKAAVQGDSGARGTFFFTKFLASDYLSLWIMADSDQSDPDIFNKKMIKVIFLISSQMCGTILRRRRMSSSMSANRGTTSEVRKYTDPHQINIF